MGPDGIAAEGKAISKKPPEALAERELEAHRNGQ